MSIKRKVLAIAAMLTMVGGMSTVGTRSASAATPECGPSCISIFSRAFGTYAQPNFVEAVLGGGSAGRPAGDPETGQQL
jgi:hypothetical protein